MQIVTRSDAIATGLKRYFTGEPCRSGHVAERATSNRTCFACKALADAQDRVKHSDTRRAAKAAWAKANKERKAAAWRAWSAANPEKVKAAQERWKSRSDAKDRNLASCAKWRAKNPGAATRWKRANPEAARIHSVMDATRRLAAKLKATPSWADFDAIRKVYEDCAQATRETGIVHHVDHIIPLRGRTVRGLHVHYNLRVIPAAENCAKSNKLEAVLCQPA